jgi:hypothetical protein
LPISLRQKEPKATFRRGDAIMNQIDSFSMNSFRLDGKVAMVTGANQGLGMAYALAFAKAGADLFIPHLTEDASEIRELIEKTGRKAYFLGAISRTPPIWTGLYRSASAYTASLTFS